jgi:HlyD family secretion protein
MRVGEPPGAPSATAGEPAGPAGAPAISALTRGRLTAAGRRRAVLVLVVLVVAATVTVLAYRKLTEPLATRVGSVVAGTVREEIIGPGTVQSRYSVSIASRVAGTLDRVLVDVGDEVDAGQIVATLDRAELEARYRATQRAVASARQEVALARANLEKARSEIDLARLRDERALKLVDVIAQAEADDARAALRAAEATGSAAVAAIDGREAELARLREEQRVAETVLSYTGLVSPMAGVITRRQLEPGSTVAPGSVVAQVVDAQALWVATLIDQSLAGRVELGQRAVIRLRSGVETSGHVERISFEADPVTRELEVDVAFDERPARFAIHEEADVTILGEQAHGLTVPLAAVIHGPDGVGVFVVEDGRARRRHVQLGVVGAQRAQVVSGLAAGESVALTPQIMRDGQRLAPVAGGG